MDPLPDPLNKIDPPLVDLKVSNPVTYIKKWWNKIIGNEGIDFQFHIRPLTALAIAIVIASVGFGVGRFVIPLKIPFFQYNDPTPSPTEQPATWKETAYIGTLQFSSTSNRYYLLTSSSSEAITLEVPHFINLESVIGKRIFAIGSYNKSTKVLQINDYKDLEILPKSPIPIPTNSPTPTVEPTPITQETQTPTY